MKSSNGDDGWLTGRLYFNREDKRVIRVHFSERGVK